MNEPLMADGLKRLNDAARFLHSLLYVGDKPSLTLRDDLPVDLTGDLVGLLHDINRAENKISVAARSVKEAIRG